MLLQVDARRRSAKKRQNKHHAFFWALRWKAKEKKIQKRGGKVKKNKIGLFGVLLAG
jgi:hypothetical protein